MTPGTDKAREARELLAAEYERGGSEGPYPTYAALARAGAGAFTQCSLRAIEAALTRAPLDSGDIEEGLEEGRVPQAEPGSREPDPQAVPALSGFDPSREGLPGDADPCRACGALPCDWVDDPSDASGVGAGLLDVWEQARSNHERYSSTGSNEDDIRFLTLGLTGEAGEVLDAILIAAGLGAAGGRLSNLVKKRWRDGDAHTAEIRREIADVCAYAFMLAQSMGLTPLGLIDIIAVKQEVFIAKMRARDSDGSGEADETALAGSARRATARAAESGIAHPQSQPPPIKGSE